ncbi:unnamed protein product [Bursaphelenchus xylophilus]|uniref:Hyaluronidase n=1 Tax=Bursaphelenchus xylophilus TaxID=6326 RepID=A0A1I7RPM2_BURXY|nr:unnamed protein product [Bursaphelenchus xylophilus]CAG9096275.1 unnamed protein product [Bursaphelenchus xylophilus]
MKITLLLLTLVYYAEATPFEIYWNVPSYQCRKYFNPEDYSITTNKNQIFRGEKLVVFYEKDLGLYPYCDDQQESYETNKSLHVHCEKPINGGVPQEVDLSAHIEKVKKDVVRHIPDENFDGLAIIDYERWRPLFDLNWTTRKIYQEYSIRLLMKKYPELPRTSLAYLSRYLFEYHAKNFLLATINSAREMRPKAKWGFWDYPLCDYRLGPNEKQCRGHYKIINEQLLWMFNASDIILPPVYFYRPESVLDRQRYVHAKMVEAEWINQKLHPKKLLVYAYAKFEYDVLYNETTKDTNNNYYSKADVCNSLKYPMEMGANGIILWSTSNYMKIRCKSLGNFLETVLGPFAAAVKRKADKCSKKECSGVGLCMSKDRLPTNKCELAQTNESECLCPAPFSGPQCQLQPFPQPQTLNETEEISFDIL